MNEIKIANTSIGAGNAPFIIAEMSGNHNQSIERALQIVDEAAKAGVNAIKLQTYTADTMTLKCDKKDFIINDPKSIWNGRHLYDLYEEAHTPWDWHEKIFSRCKEKGLIAFSTPFDETAVDFLEKFDVPAYKIASFENADLPLLKRIAKTKKPVIMSLGVTNLSEIYDSIKTLKDNGCSELVLLKCTSAYPAKPEDANLATIPHMQQLFNCPIGLSDHTPGITVPIASIALGASVIEKHFTISRKDGGVDSAFSLEPSELSSLVKESLVAWQSIGDVRYNPSSSEEKSVQFKRSIYIVKDAKSGDMITSDHIKSLRPGYGLPTKFYEFLIGKTLKKGVSTGDPFTWEMIL